MIINSLLTKIKIFGESLVKTLYHLFKTIINENPELLSKPILEKANHEFHSILTHNENKIPIKGIYYVSKTAARIGSHLGFPIEKYETQI